MGSSLNAFNIAWSLHKCSNPYIIMKSKFIGKFVECTNQQAHLCFFIFRSSCSVEICVTFGNFRSRLQQIRPRNISEMSMKIFVEFPILVLLASLLHYVKATKSGSNYKIKKNCKYCGKYLKQVTPTILNLKQLCLPVTHCSTAATQKLRRRSHL